VLTEAQVGATITVAASYTDGRGTAESVTSSATAAVANVNDAPTGSVTITGTATQGQTLTASNTLADTDGLGTISYQWKANGSNISGATASSFLLTEAQVGATITVSASYTDGHGTAESITSSGTSAIANVNDLPTGGVTISGTATQGQTLTASNTLADADGLGTLSYQWKANGTNVSGATNSSFVLTEAQVGAVITVAASYTDGHGMAESVTSSATSVVANVNDLPTGSVTISGTATQGHTLTANNTLADADGLGTVSYQWKTNGTNISGATNSSLVLTEAQVGTVITVAASYTDGHGTTQFVTSSGTSTVANVNDTPSGAVTITGTATQGQTLTASNTLTDADGFGTIAYQWKANGSNISGATNSSFVLTEAQVGTVITVAASYTDGHGTAESITSSATAAVANLNDAPSGSVTITGTAIQGQTLTATHTLADADNLGSISYQWQSTTNGTTWTNLATSATLALAEAQVGQQIRVQASYIDGHGIAESATSSTTATVANANDLPTGNVTIGGTATQGQTLTASNTLADADGLGTIGYQWQVSTIGGIWSNLATGSNYVLTESQVGQQIRIQASYTDGHGTAESVVSNFTAAVANFNDAPTGSVTISGTTIQGQTLSAANTLADADGLGTVLYRWQSSNNGTNWSDLSSGNTYVLTGTEIGQHIRVQATYTDGHGTDESMSSVPTIAVAPAETRIVGTNSAETQTGTSSRDIMLGLGGNDTLDGGAGDDLLDGGSGADIMSGGAGDDTYSVDSWQDQVVEAANTGTDTVQANLHEGGISRFFNRLFSWVGLRSTPRQIQVPDNVENYFLGGNFAAAVTGNDLDNRIVGNAENNTLNGGAGNDVLSGGGGQDSFSGGAGADTFVIDRVAALVATINDFSAGTDHVGLSLARFGDLFSNGGLSVGVLGNGVAATTGAMRLYYNQTQGALYYDADGSGLMSPVQIAAFASNARPASLAATDFVLAS